MAPSPGRRVLTLCTALAAALSSGACARTSAPPLWQAVQVPTDADFAGVWFADSLNGWLTGGGWAIDGGIVGRTRDGGRSWTFQSGVVHGAGSGFALGHVVFHDSLHGIAVGRDAQVILTQDGGERWREALRGASSGADLVDLHLLDAERAWAIGPSAILKTEDGGESWVVLVRSNDENGYLSGSAIHFVDAQRGWLVGHSGNLMRSDDGGEHWSPVPLPLRPGERPTLRDVTFVDGRRGWVVGESGCIFHTSDRGATWSLQATGVPIERVIPEGEPPRPREVLPELQMPPERLALMAVGFADTQRGWAVGYYSDVAESVVLGTRDGGTTWSVEHVQPGELLHSLHVLDTAHVWAAGDRARTQPQVVLRYTGGGH